MAEAVLALKNIFTKNKNLFKILLKIIISVGIIILIITGIDPAEIILKVKESDKLFISAAFLLSLLNIYLQYLKWELVCNKLLKEYDKKKIFLSLFYGFSAGSITPARIGEYFGRAILFTEKPLLEVTAAIVIDKIFTFLIVAITGAFVLLFSFNSLIGFLSVVLIPGLLIYKRSFYFASVKRSKLFNRLLKSKQISSVYHNLSFIKNLDKKFGLKLSLISIAFYICFILQFVLLITAFTNHFAILNYIWAGSLVMFAKTIIPAISFGDLGIREGASVYFIKQAGETAAAGFNASIFLFVINILIPSVVGLILLIRNK